VAGGLFLGAYPAWAFTANPATVNVTVQINAQVSVAVASVTAGGTVGTYGANTSYAFGSLAAGVGQIASNSISVKNDSGGLRETYSLSAANTTDWTLAGASGVNQFILAATFSGSQPAGDFTGAPHNLTTTSTACSSSQFAGSTSYNCFQVSNAVALGLWFEMVMPTQVTTTNVETSTVYVFATAS